MDKSDAGHDSSGRCYVIMASGLWETGANDRAISESHVIDKLSTYNFVDTKILRLCFL